jgi:hypothetical protein
MACKNIYDPTLTCPTKETIKTHKILSSSSSLYLYKKGNNLVFRQVTGTCKTNKTKIGGPGKKHGSYVRYLAAKVGNLTMKAPTSKTNATC